MCFHTFNVHHSTNTAVVMLEPWIVHADSLGVALVHMKFHNIFLSVIRYIRFFTCINAN